MLTKKQLLDIRNRCSEEFGSSADAIDVALDEIEAQRDVVLSALRCTGEDGHDNLVNLYVAAEEYLDKLKAKDPRWVTEYGTVNVDETVY